MESPIITPREVAEYLRVSVRTVYGWIRADELPAIRLGKTYRIEQTDLERFLRRHKTVKRPLSWQHRFDSAMDKSERAFREYLLNQGYDPDALSDREAKSILNTPGR